MIQYVRIDRLGNGIDREGAAHGKLVSPLTGNRQAANYSDTFSSEIDLTTRVDGTIVYDRINGIRDRIDRNRCTDSASASCDLN